MIKTDVMTKLLIVNNAEPDIREFANALIEIVKTANVDTQYIDYAECPKTDLNAFDGIILSGSPQGDDIVEHHAPFFRWIIDYKKPVLGICAGHHVAGHLYGSELLRSHEPESGDFEISIIKPDPIFNELPNTILVKQMHNDSITLPHDFELLATSSTCKNQMMKHREKPLYTCQFHPEYNNHQLIDNFVMLCQNQSHKKTTR